MAVYSVFVYLAGAMANCHGLFNYVVLTMCGLVLLYTTIESVGIGYIIAAASCELSLTGSQKGMISAAAFSGIMVMAIFWGYLSDRFGRRAVMLPTIAVTCLVSFGSSFSISFLNMFVLRFLTGCLASASSATVYAYLGEMHSDSRRAAAIAFGSTYISLTFVVLPSLAWLIMPGRWSFPVVNMTIVPWRVFVWSWCLPGLIAVLILLILPESPRYLFSEKSEKETIDVMAKIYAWNNKKKMEDFPVKAITHGREEFRKRGFIASLKNMGILFKQPLLRCVLISHYSMFMVFLQASGLYTWMPVILNEALYSYNDARSTSLCEVMKSRVSNATISSAISDGISGSSLCKQNRIHFLLYPVSIIMGIICGIVYISIGFVTKKFSKIKIYCTVLVTTSFMLLLSSVTPNISAAIVLFILGLCAGTAASVLAAIAVEVFPTCVRALALCTLYMSGRTGAALGGGILGVYLQEYCSHVMLSITSLTIVSVLLLALWPNPKLVRLTMEERGFSY